MLTSLHIENIAVIERADVRFTDGFNVLTGETGAGKSILIDSINAVLGNRTSKELIRTGCKSACVNALFTDISDAAANKLADLGFSCDEREVSIVRTITETKSSVRVNGVQTTSAVVRELAPLLVNIHGQHDSQALLDPEKHYVYIDLLAENAPILAEYRAAFSEMMTTRRKLKSMTAEHDENLRRLELLRFQVTELTEADIHIGEIEQLKKRRLEIESAKSILDAVCMTSALLYADDDEAPSVIPMLDTACASMSDVSDKSERAAAVADELTDIRFRLEELRSGCENIAESFELDGDESAAIDERLDMYYGFSKKYGATEEEMLDFLAGARAELEKISFSDEIIARLTADLSKQVAEVKRLGAALHDSREQAAKRFSSDVAAALEFLDMPKVKITVSIEQAPYSKTGADKIELLISTNPGEPPKPLAKIASGGEMSRIMLSIKNVIAEKDPVDTLIFDEIDTGISGRAATKVGARLYDTARSRQVICVTHLAQIAAAADNHILIQKTIADDRAATAITTLDEEGRRRELARIIGSEVTDRTLAAADELIGSSGKNFA